MHPTQNLVIDVGNTRSKAAVFQKNEIVEQALFHDSSLEDWSDWFSSFQGPISNCLISNVAENEPEITDFLKKNSQNYLELSHQMPLPIALDYETPTTLGKDRIAAAAGAAAIFPQKNCLVVDCGTCIKYDLLTADGHFRGGNIAPGLRMRLRAMHEQTARLPLVEFELPKNPIGRSTETALQNGGLLGGLLELDATIRFFRKRQPDLTIVLTGGDGPFFMENLLARDGLHFEENLVLIGLNHILNHHLTVGKSKN